ncbi:MAG: hypothetical protein UY56_C0005G0033 [Parcubacteria group bacterium GW2011_GWA1_50_14]|nr:MAG: hypothetical protein UY56_C0005G0033 [Parcubacteria group bacterium GW2011_GWA1_50_14]
MRVDPTVLDEKELKVELKKALKGVGSAEEAERKIREYFSPSPLVAVDFCSLGNAYCHVLIEPRQGGPNLTFTFAIDD